MVPGRNDVQDCPVSAGNLLSTKRVGCKTLHGLLFSFSNKSEFLNEVKIKFKFIGKELKSILHVM